jgi:hypothetical protein
MIHHTSYKGPETSLKHLFYFKHALKLIKIETLRALGDQDSSPKNF